MSAYTTQAAITANICAADLIAALDDDSSGVLNVPILNQIIENVSTDIDGMLGGLYNIPFNPIPSMVANGALAMACYQIYRRALTPDEKNTFKDENDKYVKMFLEVRNGDKPFDVTVSRTYTPFVVSQYPLVVDETTA